MATVLSCVLRYRCESGLMGAMYNLMNEMLFDWSIHLSVKIRLMNVLGILMRY
jgi:hypothetical protein